MPVSVITVIILYLLFHCARVMASGGVMNSFKPGWLCGSNQDNAWAGFASISVRG